jgi:membrane-associated phospholipid phosphatase
LDYSLQLIDPSFNFILWRECMDTIWPIEIGFTRLLQSAGGWLLLPMRLITLLGNEEFYMLVMPALYWCVDAVLGLRIGIILLTSGILNGTAKLIFKSPRPYWFDTRVAAHSTESSFGMPSGHAMNSMSVWGLLAVSLRKKGVTIITAGIILLIGISRIYLGVHFTSDVLVGWLLGALLLLVFLRLEKRVDGWVKTLPFGRFVLIMFLISLAVIAGNALIIRANADWQVPSSWLTTAAATAPEGELDPLSLDGTITNAAVLFGLASGAVWMNRKGGFNAGGKWWQRLIRFLIGVVGVLILWAGLGKVFPHTADLLGFTLRYVRYAMTGAWISVGAPLVFLRLGLAEKAK